MPRTEPEDPGPVLVLLAAGRGSRMGGPKLLLEHGGRTWLERQLESWRAAGGYRVVLVIPPEGPRSGWVPPLSASGPEHTGWSADGLMLCPNPRPERGMFSSLWCALERLPGRELLVQPLDVPLAGAETLAALLAAPLDARDSLQPVCDGLRGHPVRLGPALAARLAALDPADPAQRLDHALARLARCRHGLPTTDARPFLNLNTPADWQAFRTGFLARDREPDPPGTTPGDA